MIKTGFVRFLSSVKENLQPSQHIVQGYVSLWRIFIFITGAFVVSICNNIDAKNFFSPRLTTAYKINVSQHGVFDDFNAYEVLPLYVFVTQAVSAMIMYQSCKYLSSAAIKIQKIIRKIKSL